VSRSMDAPSDLMGFARARIGTALLLPLLGLVASGAACGSQALDVGRSTPPSPIPADERNPVILVNDGWTDNWSGEYAVLFANAGGPALVGIVVNATKYWDDLEVNVTGWNGLVEAARSSNLRNIPDITISGGSPLAAPADGKIESTVPNRSAGAMLIVELSRQLSLPWRPVVVLACSQLTDLADAYLMDPTVVDRVVVVASLGSYSAPKGLMTGPNGDLDPWADWIVAQRFSYVQISATHEQSADATADELARLPKNKFVEWMVAKQPNLLTYTNAVDQIAVLAVAVPGFVTSPERCSSDISAGFNSPRGQGPPLVPDANGNAWLVTQITSSLARSSLWQALQATHMSGS
jgi:hypothetical protein